MKKSANKKMKTYVDMCATFRLLMKDADGNFRIVTKKDVADISVGGFIFEIDGKNVPFDFEASGVKIEEGLVNFQSGYGPFFNAHYLDDSYDDEYEKLGIQRNSLTASVLAATEKIEEFYVTIWDGNGEEYGIGVNSDPDADFRLEVIEIEFADENANCYEVASDVIRCFNSTKWGGDSNA